MINLRYASGAIRAFSPSTTSEKFPLARSTFASSKYGVQVIDCEMGKLVGEFGSYGNMDCHGKGSACPHPELPFGTVIALAVSQDRLFAVDAVN